jgi:hypothetical protein
MDAAVEQFRLKSQNAQRWNKLKRILQLVSVGAGGRTRTDMSVTSPDFESGAYTDFATPAERSCNAH